MVFDTWIYQHEDNLFQALCAAFLVHVEHLIEKEHRGKQADAGFIKTSKRILKIAAAIGSRATQGILTHYLGRSLGSIFNPQAILQAADQIEDAPISHLYDAYVNPSEELRNAFFELLEQWPLSHAPVILIDDLDRCAPNHAIDMLDAVRTLLASLATATPGLAGQQQIPQFLVALDRDMIVDAMGQKFVGIESFDGNRYLEKVFPYCFYVPTGIPSDAVHLLQKCLATDSQSSLLLSDNSRSALEKMLEQPFFANPRLIKRTLNRYRLYLFAVFMRSRRQLSEDQDLPPHFPDRGLEKEKRLVSWIAACERWPMLRTLLQRRREEYWKEMANAVQAHNYDQMPGPLAKKLLGQQAALAWMKQENLLDNIDTRQAFRDADQALRVLGL